MISNKNILWATIKSLINVPYIWGGNTPMGADCSGGVQILLQVFGLDLKQDQTSDMLFRYYSQKEIGYEPNKAEFGDLIFFGSTQRITHVAMVVNHDHMFEFGGGGSRTKTVQDAERDNAFGRIRPIKSRRDFVGIRRIKKLEELLND